MIRVVNKCNLKCASAEVHVHVGPTWEAYSTIVPRFDKKIFLKLQLGTLDSGLSRGTFFNNYQNLTGRVW